MTTGATVQKAVKDAFAKHNSLVAVSEVDVENRRVVIHLNENAVYMGWVFPAIRRDLRKICNFYDINSITFIDD